MHRVGHIAEYLRSAFGRPQAVFVRRCSSSGAAWVPRFVDYLSLAFWTATAVSLTDISAIKPWAKAVMMLEAAGSIALAVLVIGYAVNLL